MAERQPISQLFFLRFLGAVIVVIHHYGTLLFAKDGFWFEFFDNGGFVLSFFFVLSGYVIGYNYFEPNKFNTPSFLLRRSARLVPIYLIAFACTLITLMGILGTFPKGLSIILQGLMLHAWVPSMVLDINYPSWSVSVELFFILLYPLIVRFLAGKSFKTLVLASLIVWVLSSLQHIAFERYVYDQNQKWTSELILYFPLWHINSFLIGLASAQAYKRLRDKNIPKWIAPLVAIACVGTILAITGTDNFIRPHIHNGLLAPLLGSMMVAFSLDTSFVSGLLTLRPLVYLGNLTYAIYIFQYPVYLWVDMYIIPASAGSEFFLWFSVILLLFSAAVYELAEVPIRKLILRKFG